jgi:hypothetical protein
VAASDSVTLDYICGHRTTATITCSICPPDCHRHPFSQVSA